MNDCLFCKFVNQDIPTTILYQDELVLAFPDIRPQTPTHILVIPKLHLENLSKIEIDNQQHQMALGRMIQVADKLAIENGSPEGCRLIINNRTIGNQEIMHIHMHILGGKSPLGRMVSIN